jgi:hypothetical protein
VDDGGGKLSHKHEEAIAALLTRPSIRSAAAECGVSDRTLRNWLKVPEFAEAYAAARRQGLQVAVGRLHHGAQAAVTTLLRKLRSNNDGTAVKAALGILAEAFRGADLLDISERLSALEAEAAARGAKP